MDDTLKALMEVIENLNSSIQTLKSIKCTCNDYVEHTCSRCDLVNKLNAIEIDTSEAITSALKESAE